MNNSEKKNQIILAFEYFEKQARSVISELSDYLKDKVEINIDWAKVPLRKNDLLNGTFGDWTYSFHGDSCAFLNQISGQLIDVKMYGHQRYLPNGNYYLLRFIQTTEEFTSLSKNLCTEREFRIMLDELVVEEKLINFYASPFFLAVLPKKVT